MPEQVVSESIMDEADQFDFQIPETGVSFNKLANYLRETFHLDGDATVTSKLSHTDPEGYSLHAELTGGGSSTSGFDGKNIKLQVLMSEAASALLRDRNQYVYAAALSVKERSQCYSDGQHCDFSKARLAYESVPEIEHAAHHFHLEWVHLLPSIRDPHYHEWALLGLSKIREDERDYVGELQLAKLATERWPEFSWGYYNWGVALVELGCYAGAIEAFSQTIAHRPNYAAAYNARGRIHLMQAEALLKSGKGDVQERSKAIRDFRDAISLNSDYAEAHINLGKARRLDPTEYPLARVEFEAVIETPSSHVARAYQQLAILEKLQGDDSKFRDDMRNSRSAMTTNTVCRFDFAHSLREASGCMEPAETDQLPHLSSSLDCRRHRESLPRARNDDDPPFQSM